MQLGERFTIDHITSHPWYTAGEVSDRRKPRPYASLKRREQNRNENPVWTHFEPQRSLKVRTDFALAPDLLSDLLSDDALHFCSPLCVSSLSLLHHLNEWLIPLCDVRVRVALSFPVSQVYSVDARLTEDRSIAWDLAPSLPNMPSLESVEFEFGAPLFPKPHWYSQRHFIAWSFP